MAFGGFGGRWMGPLTKSAMQYRHDCCANTALARPRESAVYRSMDLLSVETTCEGEGVGCSKGFRRLAYYAHTALTRSGTPLIFPHPHGTDRTSPRLG